MKKLSLVLLVVLVAGMLFPAQSAVSAQSATNTSWTSSITYYTTSTDANAELSVVYYDGVSSYTVGPFAMGAHGAGSINIGSTSVPDGFAGSAVLSANVPIFATYVQFAKDAPTEYSRSLYTGFDSSKAGEKFYLATARAQGVSTSTIGVQNVETFEITATIEFYAVGATTPTFTAVEDIPANASYISSLRDLENYPGGNVDGSIVITAVKKGTTEAGRVVATAQETLDNGRSVYSYEGASSGATEVYIPSAMCNRNGQTSYFAIQNTGDAAALVVVDYYDLDGNLVGSMPETSIAEGAKLSTNPCNNNLLVGALGSAVMKSNNSQPIIAIGKISSTGGLLTAFAGETTGATTIVAPYVRWAANTATSWSAYLAVMNVGLSEATDIKAYYYDAAGTLRATVDLATVANPLGRFIKVNTNASSAGALINDSFGYPVDGGANGGSVEIVSDQPIVAIVRLATNPTTLTGITILGEDYNAIAVP